MESAGGLPQLLPYRIPLPRVLFMTVLSYGLYLFYWFYLTWKQYRDHTRTEVFPVWHALTLLVPIYALFRTYAHMRSFNELIRNAGLSTTISAGGAVVLVLISSVLDGISLEFGGGFTSFEEITRETAILIAVLDIISISIVVGLLRHAQSNLNKYWENLEFSQPNVRLADARIGIGEVIFGLIGILIWVNTLGNLFSAGYRGL